MTLSCLVTGFDAFAGETFNSSEVIACSMPETLTLPGKRDKVPVQNLVLPTCGDEAWQKLEPVLKAMTRDEASCVVVMLGLASKRSMICLERFALNIRDDQTPDNRGHSFAGEIIDQTAPAALRTNSPIEDVLKHLCNQGLSAEISNHCGTFVCNEIYFRTLQYFNKLQNTSLVSFIHLPLPENYGDEAAAENKEVQIAAMQSTVQAIVEYYLSSLSIAPSIVDIAI